MLQPSGCLRLYTPPNISLHYPYIPEVSEMLLGHQAVIADPNSLLSRGKMALPLKTKHPNQPQRCRVSDQNGAVWPEEQERAMHARETRQKREAVCMRTTKSALTYTSKYLILVAEQNKHTRAGCLCTPKGTQDLCQPTEKQTRGHRPISSTCNGIQVVLPITYRLR